MNWRPDDWVSGYEENEALDGLDGPELYEAGANAMLKALRKRALTGMIPEGECEVDGKAGVMVFIPEEGK